MERLGANHCNPLLGITVDAAESTYYQIGLRPSSPKYLQDHQLHGSPIAPAAVYLEQGLAAAEQVFGEGDHALEDVSLQGAMYLSEEFSRKVQVTLAADSGGGVRLRSTANQRRRQMAHGHSMLVERSAMPTYWRTSERSTSIWTRCESVVLT